jgi:superoxide reductase
MKKQTFCLCRTCGKLVGVLVDASHDITCCGKPMEVLVPNTTDAAQEKHVPVVTVNGAQVEVKLGSAPHPMTEEHLITWVYLQTERGGQRKCLAAGEPPQAVFTLVEDKPLAAFAYCNLHGLWSTDII